MRVLFICRNNSARSQFAEAFFNKMGKKSDNAVSAGAKVEEREGEPIDSVNVLVMKELGYDLSKCKRKQLDSGMVDSSDMVVSMVPRNMLPRYLARSKKLVYWRIRNPEGYMGGALTNRKTRDIVKARIKEFVGELAKNAD